MKKQEKKKESLRESLGFDLTFSNILLIFLGILINCAGRRVAENLTIPFWLDTVGTFLVALRLGTAGAVATGICSNVIFGLTDEAAPAYVVVGIGIALSIGTFYPRKRKKEWFPVIATAVFSGAVAVVLSTPLNFVFYDGYTGNAWGDGLIDMLSPHMQGAIFKSILGEAFVDLPDKAVSVLIAVSLLSLWDLFCGIARKLHHAKKDGATLKLMVLVCAGTLMMPLTAEAVDFNSDYAGISYNTEDGLVSAEINAIEQTGDGYIWLGTYSGLYRYDGADFSRIDLGDKMNSITQLFTDMKKRLWIGTNDSGVACYDPADGSVVWYDIASGLAANSIRSICEDGDGNIYVGTIAELCMINDGGGVKVFDRLPEVSYVRSMAYDGSGGIAGVTNGGELFFLKNGSLLAIFSPDEESGDYYAAVASNQKGSYIVGTSSNYAYRMHLKGVSLITEGRVEMGEVAYFNRIRYVPSMGGYFYCCENGLGMIDEESNQIMDLSTSEFNSSVSDMIVDYQENVWFVSNKQGVLRFSQNPFEDVFEKAGIDHDIVNSLLIKDGILYIGMDSGLAEVDLETMERLHAEYEDIFDGVRIRNLMEDSSGNMWVSTYGEQGLVCIFPGGETEFYNEAEKGTTGTLFRLAIELSDGRILAASTTGLNFITDGELTGEIGVAEGLPTAQVLSMVEAPDGRIRVGTDGDGVYILKDDKIERRIGEEEGLASLVILRIVPCTGGYIYVTSNALYYDNGERIRKLDHFPYSNNYDIHITEDGKAWVSSSAGIYVVSEKNLLENREGYNYTLLNRNRGFYTTLTANAKNAVKGDDLYLCCTDGVKKISLTSYNEFNDNYDIRLSSVTIGEEEVFEENGQFCIPARNGRVEFNVAVLNFTLSNPLVRIFLEGVNDEGITRYQNEMDPVYYTDLGYGDYTLHVQIIDESDDHVIRDEVFPVHKDAQIFERVYFKLYLIFVCVMFVLFIGMLIGNVRSYFQNVNGLQQAVRTDPMTGLLNKATSEDELMEICKKEKGMLLMIDLDSFKLVNDLYGHDMGDKILIRFAELIKGCLHSDDMAGRMGGDEFIAFMRNVKEESAIAERAKYINEELLISAKEYMGEDMTIPLGASIGAVSVPDEGRDFPELYQKADKALYAVKQNGKHGYALYQKNSRTQEADNSQAGTLAGLKMIMGERNRGKNAFQVDFEKMQVIYRIFALMRRRYSIPIRIAQISLKDNEGDKESQVPDEISEEFEELLTMSLRESDIVTKMADKTFLVVLTDIDNPTSGGEPFGRIERKWKSMQNGLRYSLTYDVEQIEV